MAGIPSDGGRRLRLGEEEWRGDALRWRGGEEEGEEGGETSQACWVSPALPREGGREDVELGQEVLSPMDVRLSSSPAWVERGKFHEMSTMKCGLPGTGTSGQSERAARDSTTCTVA